MFIPKNDKKPEILAKQKKREWQIRMNEEIKHDRTGKFITLTFSNEELNK